MEEGLLMYVEREEKLVELPNPRFLSFIEEKNIELGKGNEAGF